MSKRDKKHWCHYHLSKAENAAESIVTKKYAYRLGSINTQILNIERSINIATKHENTISKFLSYFGHSPHYRIINIQPLEYKLSDLLCKRTELKKERLVAQNTARCKRQKQYQHNHAGRIIKKEECAKRVQVRKENRHIKYLETAPNLRSAQKGLKKKLIIESEDIDGYVCCYYCGKCIKTDDSNLHFEYKKPVARGGKNNVANLELACASCNLSKGQKTEAEFREARNI